MPHHALRRCCAPPSPPGREDFAAGKVYTGPMTDDAPAPLATPAPLAPLAPLASSATGWPALVDELDAWAAAGRTATLWWRDDDATQAGPRLARLLGLAAAHQVPLALAVIPAAATPGLREAVHQTAAAVTVVQHGYAHQNHATAGEKAMELGGHRPAPHVIAELAVGHQRLASWPNFVPVLVPPWNRIAPHLVPLLPSLGFTGLSTFGPRPPARDPQLAPTVVRVNAHIDPIAWRRRADTAAPPPFVGIDTALSATVDHLRHRRLGTVDCHEPTGLLTHHRDHDGDLWRFIEALLSRTLAHPAVRWLSVQEAFHL